MSKGNFNGIDPSCVSSHESKGGLLSSLWRVYSVLMEYANSNDYQSQIMDVLDESKRILADKENDFSKILNNEKEKYLNQKDYIVDLEKRYQAATTELN